MKTKKNVLAAEHQETGVRRLRGAALISVLIALLLTLWLEALDQTIVGTALPKIIADLARSGPCRGWVLVLGLRWS